jgi:hypothetical protein
MKATLKRTLPSAWQRRLRRLSRLRWVTKYRVLRTYDVRIRDDPWRNLRYVLWDPEVESHSYEVENVGELAQFVAALLDVPERQVLEYVGELDVDPELNERLRRQTRWRFDVKTGPPPGSRLLWYALARTLKPRLIVETGIYQGLGSLVLLRALEQNAREGVEGSLLSIDADPDAGTLVHPRVQGRWRKVVGMTNEILESELDGQAVGMMIQDTGHTYENQSFEFGVVHAHRAERLVLIDNGGGQTDALRDLCARAGGVYQHFRDRPLNHFYPAGGSGVGLIPRSDGKTRA